MTCLNNRKNDSFIFCPIKDLIPLDHKVREIEAAIDWNFIYHQKVITRHIQRVSKNEEKERYRKYKENDRKIPIFIKNKNRVIDYLKIYHFVNNLKK